MTAHAVLFLLLLLSIKHFWIDFPLQGPYQWMNKGTYMHPGGLLHSGLHGAVTFLILLPFVHWSQWQLAAVLSIAEYVAHYHIDWAKMNLNKKMGWGANTHPQFWTLLGVDQLLHTLTYLWIVWMIA